jgi:hypothetical protein
MGEPTRSIDQPLFRADGLICGDLDPEGLID